MSFARPSLPFPAAARKSKRDDRPRPRLTSSSLFNRAFLPNPSRRTLCLIAYLVIIPFCIWSIRVAYVQLKTPDLPPNYYEWHDRENAMPQNNPNLPRPQGRHGRYIRFKNHLTTVGWGNSMQEMVINAHLAYRANRIFVMYNYTWDKHAQGDYSKYNNKLIPARIPISALAAGPIAGGPFPSSDWRPPAVTTEFFEQICPNPTILDVSKVKGDLAMGTLIMDAMVSKLNSIEDNCVEFQENSGEVFDFWVFGDANRMAGMWPQLMESPILTEWAWSPLVMSAFESNRRLIHPAIQRGDGQRTELPGLLALHLRRGDFRVHCEHLAKWRSQYNALNVRPDFPDHFVAPPGGGDGNHTPETLAFYLEHCFPEIDQIVARVQTIRAEAKAQGRLLNRIYVLTNGSKDWVEKLTSALKAAGRWQKISTSRDLKLTWDQNYVKQAVDMLVATRAEVFVGNAWSSLSSNVNMLRISQHHNPETSRFW